MPTPPERETEKLKPKNGPCWAGPHCVHWQLLTAAAEASGPEAALGPGAPDAAGLKLTKPETQPAAALLLRDALHAYYVHCAKKLQRAPAGDGTAT